MGESQTPRLFRFSSVGDWLEAYVRSEIERLKPERPDAVVSLPAGDALYLCGSIGYDSALAPDGQVWINEYDDPREYAECWRVTNRTERLELVPEICTVR